MRINLTKCCCLLMLMSQINFSLVSSAAIKERDHDTHNTKDVKGGFDIVLSAVVLMTASIAAVSVSVWRAG